MDRRKIGQRLAELRKKKDLSQLEAAELLGISASALGMYEQGRRIPRDEVKLKIAQYYNVPVQSLFLVTDHTLRRILGILLKVYAA